MIDKDKRGYLILCIGVMIFIISMAMGEEVAYELAITIHVTLFFHLPLAKVISDKGESTFINYLCMIAGIRFMVLGIANFIINPVIVLTIDAIILFLGAFITIAFLFGGKKNTISSGTQTTTFYHSSTVDTETGALDTSKVSKNVKLDAKIDDTKVVMVASPKFELVRCNNCHALNRSDVNYCESCGSKIAAATLVTKPGLCPKCNARLNPGVIYCTACGFKLDGDINGQQLDEKDVPKNQTVDPELHKKEDALLTDIIKKELHENGYTIRKVIPAVRKRKYIFTLLFAIVTLVAVSLIFFHLPLAYYLVYVVLTFIYIKSMKKYDVYKYIIKQVKSRPDEKIGNIVASICATAEPRKSVVPIHAAILVCAVVIPCIYFINPRIYYEEIDGGYSVRFYAFGLTNFTSVKIPDEYKGEDVVSLRGNAFSNMFFLTDVDLPDTLTEIRGQAFKNCYNLEKIDLPKNLVRIGGSAFANCKKLKSIEFPDTVTEIGGQICKNCSSLKNVHLSENLVTLGGGAFANCKKLKSIEFSDTVTAIGGESFMNDTSLESVILSQNITEIRGDTFSGCTALKEIDIPDSVTRIGGHAFYEDSSLSRVGITENSQLKEIGSSAFRLCTSLQSIYLPKGVSLDERSFKESPTVISYYSNIEGVDSTFRTRNSYFYGAGSNVILYDSSRANVLYEIVLNNISYENGAYKYSFSVTDQEWLNFDIYSNSKSLKIDENLYVEVNGSSSTSITLEIYYK